MSIWRSAQRLVRYRQTRETIMGLDLTKAKALGRSDDLLLREANESDAPLISDFNVRHEVDKHQRERVSRYLKHRHHGVLAFVESELIGYVWWTDNTMAAADRHPHLDIYGIVLGDKDVYMVDAYIAPAGRGAGRALSLMSRVQADLGDLGYEKAYGICADANVAAKWTYKMTGWREERRQRGHVLFERIGYLNGRVFPSRSRMF